ncbi:MotA/TolQ/ExbB proton channel family protein [Psychrobacter sp. YP14]|uniref:MotA/TolQ/ExbB proton channel family protein n=1 Tax=Psychrobacter sp. YP14 TaxID=2203895 RepID=UPI000D7E45D0|nr:MotA/TolQ/ExbB proton channel family protein [Psychrobacter sp. YP14]AWT49275.1 MotA/TolQ/ExbB proton channel family protein [Psychrobacter sp. YP14]
MDFAAYWQYTDIVTKFLFFSLLGLSIASWIAGILRLYQSSQLKSTVATDLTQAVSAESKNLSALGSSERKTVVEQVLMKEIGRYRYSGEKGLAILGTTAAIAPFIGLFGTVWGIFHALHSIGESGQAGLSQVAGPVGEALIMTGLGLAVAIPAVIFYNIAIRINRHTLFIANDTAYGLLGDTAKPMNSGAAAQVALKTQAQSSKDGDYASLNTSTANTH